MSYHISYQQEWKNRWTVIKQILRNPLRESKIFNRNYQVPALYKDIVKSDESQTGLHIPRWLNLGYWKTATRYDEACKDMAILLAKKADIKQDDIVLDVGFGYGEQDLIWYEWYRPKKIIGINITKFQVEIAQEKIAKAGLENWINLLEGDATVLPFPEESFDKVLALESAFHFNERTDFFTEAFRVLRKGGKIVIADVIPGKERKINFWLRLQSKRLCIPFANQYNRLKYIQKLQLAGFENIEYQDISQDVFPGVIQLFAQKGKGITLDKVNVNSNEKNLVDWYNGFGWFFGFDEYIIFSAQKTDL